MAGFVQKFKDMWTPPEDEYEYEDEYEEDVEEEQPETEEKIYSRHESNFEKKVEKSSTRDKVVNIHSASKLQVVLFKPERFGEETRAIADELLKMHTVVLNLENTNSDVSRRIIDFLSGVAYANGGKIKRVATDTFIITPYNVDMAGEESLVESENTNNYF